MKKLLLLILVLLLPCLWANAEVIRLTPTPTTDLSLLVLKPSRDEVKAYSQPNYNSPIAGYIIVGGRQEVHVLSTRGDWCYISFTSINGTDHGWVPRTFFETQATPTPVPTATPSPTPTSMPLSYVNNYGTGGRLNLRSRPDVQSESRGKYYTGTPVVLLGRTNNGYAEVSVGMGDSGATMVKGWMDERYLTRSAFVSEMPSTLTWNPGRGVNMRVQATDKSGILRWVPHGTAVSVMGVLENGWYHVQVGNQTGFMYAELLRDEFPWAYGQDSDAPVSDVISGGNALMYVVSRNGTDRLNLRESAAYDAKSLGKFYQGTQVTVQRYTRTGWAYVTIGAQSGYMDTAYLSATRPMKTGAAHIVRNGYGTGLNLRDAPGYDSRVMQLVPNGSRVTVLGLLNDGWAYVQFGSQTGYMQYARLSPTGT